jgi:hypothetical protein
MLKKKSCSRKKSCSGFLEKVGIPKKVWRLSEFWSGSRGVQNSVPGDPRKPGFMRNNPVSKLHRKIHFLVGPGAPPGPAPTPPAPPGSPRNPVPAEKPGFYENTSSRMARHLARVIK